MHTSRKQRATQLRKDLETGPSFLSDSSRRRQAYELWYKTWIEPAIERLIVELKPKPDHYQCTHRPCKLYRVIVERPAHSSPQYCRECAWVLTFVPPKKARR